MNVVSLSLSLHSRVFAQLYADLWLPEQQEFSCGVPVGPASIFWSPQPTLHIFSCALIAIGN